MSVWEPRSPEEAAIERALGVPQGFYAALAAEEAARPSPAYVEIAKALEGALQTAKAKWPDLKDEEKSLLFVAMAQVPTFASELMSGEALDEDDG